MGVEHQLFRGSEEFRGLDKRSSDIMRTQEYATDMKNAAYRVSGAINKRKGYHSHILDTQGSYGMITYTNVNTTTGAVTEEVLKVTANLEKLTETNLNLQYSGTESVWYSIILDSGTETFKFKVSFSASTEVSIDIGTGLGHVSDKTLTALASALNTADSTLSLNVASIGSEKAAFLDIVSSEPMTVSSGNNYIKYKQWTAITKGDTGVSEDFNGYLRATQNLDDAELTNATFAQLNNVIYIANGYDNVMKYDGAKIYKAGLPNPTATAPFTVEWDGSGTAMDALKNYDYKVVYEYTDDKGNIITSQPSDTITLEIADPTLSGNTGQADLEIAAFPTAGFDFASSKIKILVYRTKGYTSTAGQFYLINHADDVTASRFVHTDSNVVTNTSATPDFIDKTPATTGNPFLTLPTIIKRHDPPPKGKFITTFRDCLIVTGQRTNVNNLQYSLPKNTATGEIGSEYFPDDDNGTIVESSFGDKITAVAPLRDALYIFHKNSIHILTGDIAEPEGLPYRVDLLTTEGGIGCEAHHTIEELKGELLFLSNKGIYGINTSNNLREVSNLIQPLFATKDLSRKRTGLKKVRATGFNWVSENIYVLHIPTESLDDGAGSAHKATITTSDSIIVAYDYAKDAWLQWDSLDFSGGVTVYDERLFFNNRSKNTDTDEIQSVLSSMSDTDSTYDYADHATAISFEYDTNWESLREPTVPKKYLRLKVYAMDTDGTFESPGFTLNATLQKDYNFADLGTISLDFGASSQGGWGEFPWGSGSWGNAVNRWRKTKLPSSKARSLKVRYSNSTLNENILITNYELEIASPYRMEMKE